MKKKVISSILLCVLSVTSLYGCSDKSKQSGVKVEDEYVPVSTESVEARTISEESTFSGKITPIKDVMIVPKVPGKVTNVNVEVGNKVSIGKVLFTLDKTDIQNQVDQASKQVELVKSNYERSEEQISQAGKSVDLAKSNYERSKEQIEQAKKSVELTKSNYEKAKQQVDNAKINLERTKKLYEAGAVSKSQYEQAELGASDKNLKILEIQVEQAELAVSNSGLDSARIQIEQAELGASDSALNTARIQIEQAELGYQQALDALKNTSITAPINGVVSQVNINPGEIASNAQPSIVILDTSKMYVEIDVPENIISKITTGEDVDISIASTEDTVKGKIELISPAPDDRTKLYLVKVSINEIPSTVKAGMFAKVKININSKKDIVAVKSDAIIEDGTKSYVYTLEKDKAKKREVELGISSDEYTEVTSGVKVGEVILVKGQNYVGDGSKVKVIRGED